MNTPNLLQQFIGEYPNQAQAAVALNVSEALISRLLGGSRNVSAKLAQRIEEVSEGRYCKSALLWGDTNNKH